MVTGILCLFLIILLYFSYKIMDGEFVSPAVVFVFPFCVATLCAAIYSKKWELQMHADTFLTIFLGCLEFVLVCSLIHFSYGKSKRNIVRNKIKIIRKIIVQKWLILIIIGIQIFSLVYVTKSMRTSLAQYGISGDLGTIMYYYRSFLLFNSDKKVYLSELAGDLRIFSMAVAYIWAYILTNNIHCKSWKDSNFILLFISYVLGILNSMILGSRGEALQIIISTIIVYFIIMKIYNGWKIKVGFKQILKMFVIFAALFIGFQGVGDLLGRSSVVKVTSSAIDGVAVYLGAEIKNLDMFLSQPIRNNQVFGSQVFGVILNWIDVKYQLGWNIQSILTFNKVNGVSLGNVYTLFAPIIYDFGYFGIFIIIGIEALVYQVIYENVQNIRNEIIYFRVILIGYLLSILFFSFFGERFFATILNFAFSKYLLCWFIIIKLLNVKIVFGRKGRLN